MRTTISSSLCWPYILAIISLFTSKILSVFWLPQLPSTLPCIIYLLRGCYLLKHYYINSLLFFFKARLQRQWNFLNVKYSVRDVFHSLNLTEYTLKYPSPPLRCPYDTWNAPVCLDTTLSIITFGQDINKGLATQLTLMHELHFTIIF